MKKHQLIVGLCSVASLTACQNLSTELGSRETHQQATIITPKETYCGVFTDMRNNKFVSFQLQFDTNNNRLPDTEMCVSTDVTNVRKKDVKSYIKSIHSLPEGAKALDEWKYQVLSHSAPGSITEIGFYRIREQIQHTK